jgi:hypothetical protein
MGGTEAILGQVVLGGLSALRKSRAARTQNQQLAAQQAIQEQQIAASRQIEDRRRKEQLRQDRAAQRARFGALGLSAGGGSAAADLRGLSTRSALDAQDRNRLSDIRLRGIGQEFTSRRRRNLLEVRNNFLDRSIGLLKRNASKLFYEPGMPELIISDVLPRVQYTADGVQTSFPYPFPIFDQADLVVVFDDNGAPGANSVSGVGVSGGGDVVFDSPPPLATRITIYRDMAFARETDFQEAGDFRAAVINEELDRMAMLLQQAEMLVGDSVHKPLYEAGPALVLPSAATRAGKVLTFDEDGLPTIGTPSEEAATLAATSAAAAAASAAAAAAEADYVINTAVPVAQYSGDGATLAFVLNRAVVDSTSIAVTIDGVKQHTATYSAAGTALTFTEAPPAGTDNIEVTFIGAMGLIANLATIPDGALAATAISGAGNQIINPNFDIWQRGASFAAANIHAADRWFVGTTSTPSSLAITRVAFAPGQTDVPGEPAFHLRVDQGDNNTLFGQRIEDVRRFAGRQATYSFYAKADFAFTMAMTVTQNFGSGGSGDVTVASPTFAITTSWQKFSVTVTVPPVTGKTIGDGSYLIFNHSVTGDLITDYAAI